MGHGGAGEIDMSPLFGSTDHADDVAIGIATIVISAFVSWVTARRTIRGDERRAIFEGTARLIEWAIEYPFLEDDEFCRSWPETNRSRDDNMRYENYCCHVFNQVEHAWELFKGDELKMRPTLYPEELISRHRVWWESDETNQKAYPNEFRQFVATVIRRLDKEKTNG
jgi:hypothetical protein